LCPEDNVVKARIREAIRQFCSDTEAWTEKVVVDEVADQTDYPFTLTGDAIVKRIISVKVKTSETQEFDRIGEQGFDSYDLSDDGRQIEFTDSATPKHDIDDGIQFKFALQPTMDCDVLSGDMVERYGYGIGALAKHKLMITPKTPYFSPDLAQYWFNEYKNARMEAIRDKYTAHKNVGLHVQQLGGLI
jgi:hypothetical protein